MKTAATRENLDRGIRAAWRDSIESRMPGWPAFLLILGAALSLCSCGRVNEIAAQKQVADEELTDVRLQFSELNKEIAQAEKDNATLRDTLSGKDGMSPAEFERSIQETELRITNLKTEKDKALKRLDEARRSLAAQQSRGKR